MKDKPSNGLDQEHGKNSATLAPERETKSLDLHPDQELVYRIKSSIDQRGRYSFRLGDMAAGFAAGKDVSPTMARHTIENRFKEQLGMSPKEYLDKHYDELRAQGIEVRPERQRNNGKSRGR